MALSVEVLIFGVHVVVTLAFITYMIRIFNRQKAEHATPGTLTTLGILGTFTGIFLGLLPFILGEFHIGPFNGDISKNVPHLIGGIAVAAVCSIFGMLFALLSKHHQRSEKLSSNQAAHTGATADTLAALLQALLEKSEIQNTSTLALQKAIIGNEEGTLLSQLKLVRTDFSDKQDALIKSFDNFAEKMAKSNSEALIDALKEVIKDFNAKINEQFGENFRHLNEAVGKLLEWQENYRHQVETLQEQFQLCANGIEETRSSMSAISDKSESLVVASQKLEKLLTAFEQQQSNLQGHLEAFSALSLEAKDAFPVIRENLKEVTDYFSNAVEAAVDDHKAMLERQQKVVDEMIRNFEALEKKTGVHTDLVFAEMQEQVEKLSSQMGNTLNQTSKRLEEQVTALDKALEQELTQSLNSLGSQLAALSSKFVSDYGPLTTKLERLVKMSSNGRSDN